MRSLTPGQVECILQMVHHSAEVAAPEEKEESFDEYSALLRNTRALPDFMPLADDAATGLVDTAFLYGVSLAFLGQVAYYLLTKLQEVAVEKGMEEVLDFARQRIFSDWRDAEPVKREATNRVLLMVRIPEGVSPQDVERIIATQINALEHSPNLVQPHSEPAPRSDDTESI